MNRITPSRILAIVITALVTTTPLSTTLAADPPKPPAGNAGAANGYEQALANQRAAENALALERERMTNARTLTDGFDSKCKAAEKEAADSMGGFLSYCKAEFRKKIAGGNGKPSEKDLETRAKAVKECAEEFDECVDLGKEEKEFASFNSSMSGAEAMPNFPFGSGATKSCSPYSRDQLDSAISKATSALGTSKKDLKDMIDKTAKNEQELQEKYDKLQKQFIEDQEAKAKATRDGEEDKLSKQAAFDKQKGEYEAQIRKSETEIFQLQQQQSLIIKNRGREINAYKIAMLKCKEEARKIQAAGSGQVASNLSNAQASDARIVFAACRSNALSDRENEAEKTKVALATVDMNLKYKMAEMQALKESANRLAQMFATSNQKQQEYEQQNEQKFLEKQQQTWLQISKAAQDKQTKAFENQSLLTDARQEVNKASNKLNDYESQEARGSKPLEDAQTAIGKFGKLNEAAIQACKEPAEVVAARSRLQREMGVTPTEGAK
jgi:hypothetical protein